MLPLHEDAAYRVVGGIGAYHEMSQRVLEIRSREYSVAIEVFYDGLP